MTASQVARRLAGTDTPTRAATDAGRVSAVNATDRPPTLTVGEGDQAKPVTLTGEPSDWHPGDLCLYLNASPSPVALAKLPQRGTGDLDDPDETEPLEDWHIVGNPDEPAFTGGWSNLGGYSPAGFYRQPDYWVRLQGVVAGTSATASVFTLPDGYRPPSQFWFTVYSSGTVGKLRVGTDGTVTMTVGGGASNIFLNGVTFPTRWNPAAWLRPQEANAWSWTHSTPNSDVAMFLRDDGWVWLRGALAGGTVNTVQMVSPEQARSPWADIHPVLGLGLGRVDHGGGGGTDRNMSAWRQRSGGNGDNIVGGANYWSYRAPDSLFTPLPFANGWGNEGGDHRPCGYYRDHFGVVHVHGVANGASKTSNILATLPPGFRPAGRLAFNGVKAGNTQGRVDVHPDGRVEDVSASTGYLSLVCVSYRAEQ